MLNTILLATTIIINPTVGYLGGIHMLETCTFDFAPKTTLTAGSSIDSHNLVYGMGSVIPPGSGIQCDLCKIKSAAWDKAGKLTITCDMVLKPPLS